MSKEKISLSLSDDIIKRVDDIMKQSFFDSRSETIEFLLRKALDRYSIDMAVIMWRVPHFVNGIPTPLIKFNGKTNIEMTLEKLKSVGVREVIIGLPDFFHEVFKILGDGTKFGLKLHYINDKGLTNADVIRVSKDILTRQFFIVSADIYFEFDLKEMISAHTKTEYLLTSSLTTVDVPGKWGNVILRHDKIVDFELNSKRIKSYLIEAGVLIADPKIIKYCIPGKQLEEETFPRLAKEGKMGGYLITGTWIHLNNKREVERLRRYLNSK